MILSIGMIVKNEEKYLKECLEGIRPILNSIDSELIIADTGSTDNTVEIAKEFTDNIFYFEWCNDFAAARNSTLRKAKGEWFMFIDADEIIKDASELINFFKSGEYKRYESASYIQRNYSNKELKVYSDFNAPRMSKIFNVTCFKGAIHEYLTTYGNKLKVLGTVAHHYGYIGDDEDLRKKKSERNIEILLNELEKDKNSDRCYLQLSQAYMSIKDYVNAEKYLSEGIKVLESKSNYDVNMLYELYAQAVQNYNKMEKNEKVIDAAEKYFSCKNKKIATDIDIYAYMIFAYMALEKYQECISTYNDFKKVYDLYIGGYLNTADLSYHSLLYVTPIMSTSIIYIVVQAYVKLKDYKQALELLTSIDLQDGNAVNSYSSYYGALIEIMNELDDYSILIDLFNKYDDNVLKMLKSRIVTEAFNNNKLLDSLCDKDINDKQFINFLKIIQDDNNNSLTKKTVEDFLDDDFVYNSDYVDIFYFMIKSNIEIEKISRINNIEDSVKAVKNLINKREDMADKLLQYIRGVDSLEDFVAISFGFNMYEVLLENAEKFDKSECFNIFTEYAEFTEGYISLAYNPAMMNDDNIIGYPSAVQFAYYASKAGIYFKNKDMLNCIRSLKPAIKLNINMKYIIELIMKSVQEYINKSDDAQNEFEAYAQKIKMALMTYINSGKAAEARKIVESYKRINPNDKDIEFIEKRIELLENN